MIMHPCRVRLREGARSEEEVTYRGKRIGISQGRQRVPQRHHDNGTLSIHELGWQRAYILRCR